MVGKVSDLEYLEKAIEQEKNYEDEEEETGGLEYTRYDITSYGIDFDVDGLVKRLKRGDIYIPPFQRDYVWKMPEASRFIESLLLGLPVPGVFLAQDQDTGKMLVIDGQQRLMSLMYFYTGEFKPIEGAKTKRIFRLSKVKSKYDGKSYEELESKDRINLDNSVIHATIVKQESPAEDDTSIYHIFERLNSGGRKLTPQEIRVAVYHGRLIEMVKELNELPAWREIFGPKNDRMKDVELILRFFAMLIYRDSYTKPMVEFINIFCAKNRNPTDEKLMRLKNVFTETVSVFHRACEEKPFRPARALNVALYESAMVGLAERLQSGHAISDAEVRDAYNGLVTDAEFMELISQSTSDVRNLKGRMDAAIDAFAR
ncbi:MAG TPA: DUF262 domain-containing protein [Pseudomonas sp.]|nr:hypothetical protein [Pseudomonas sp.]MBB49285.1 hypothetical protein [Pseudomonadales bacterium]MBO07515.1 hypothetical protein [Acidobacteriota bacterium]HCA24131.1 DUF262 domain-containing protein [Pseudomonas sp.]|tara:strand:- start:1606 stop:2721 length:1116 start_codon:yes stop_codon:yes gene_type:complete